MSPRSKSDPLDEAFARAMASIHGSPISLDQVSHDSQHQRELAYEQVERKVAAGEIDILDESEMGGVEDDMFAANPLYEELYGVDPSTLDPRALSVNRQRAAEKMERWKRQSEARFADDEFYGADTPQPSPQPRQTQQTQPTPEERAEEAWAVYRAEFGSEDDASEVERAAEALMQEGAIRPGSGLQQLAKQVRQRVLSNRSADPGRSAGISGGASGGRPAPRQEPGSSEDPRQFTSDVAHWQAENGFL